MAGIDKTYVTWDQYKKVKEFFTREMQVKQKTDIGGCFGYERYTESDFDGVDEHVLWNTPSLVDLWLANFCKLDFIQERLKQQYSENWIGWKDLDFNEKGFIISIEHKDSYVAPFKKIDDNIVEIYNEFIVYGTTFFHKLLYSAIAAVRGEYYNVLFKNNFIVNFKIFGLQIKASSNTTNGINYYLVEEDKETILTYGYFPIPYLFKGEKDRFLKFFDDYKIKHSYRKADHKKYDPAQIVISEEDSCASIDMYRNFSSLEQFNSIILTLPKYIKLN